MKKDVSEMTRSELEEAIRRLDNGGCSAPAPARDEEGKFAPKPKFTPKHARELTHEEFLQVLRDIAAGRPLR